MNKVSVLFLALAAISAAAGQILFKVGADGRQTLGDFVNVYIASGLLLYGLGTAIWIFALSREQLVNVYPFTVLTFAIVMLAGGLFFGEDLPMSGYFGVGLILFGLYLLSR